MAYTPWSHYLALPSRPMPYICAGSSTNTISTISTDNGEIAKIFHELSQAYDLLLDPAARAAFDNLLNVKVQAKARSDRYDTTRKKFMDDLKSREDAFKKQQQDEKAAAIRMKYEVLKNEM